MHPDVRLGLHEERRCDLHGRFLELPELRCERLRSGAVGSIKRELPVDGLRQHGVW